MSHPSFPATADGFRDAVSRSRRRRTRRHAVAASVSGTAVVVAAAVVLAGQPPGTDSLRQQRPVVPAEGVSPSPGPGRTSPPVATPARPAATGQPVPSASPLPVASARPRAGQPTGEPREQAPPLDRPLISTPARLTTTAYRPNTPCADTSGRAATGWCLQPDTPYAGASGRPVELAVSLCRLPGFGPGVASFPSTAEAGYALRVPSGGPRLWDHARQHPPVPGRHERRVEAGDCLTWTVTWTNRADDGEPLAPGSYELELSVLADDTGGANAFLTQTYAYRVEESA